jgi:hypothetical protein
MQHNASFCILLKKTPPLLLLVMYANIDIFLLKFSDKKDKKKEDSAPTVLKGVYVFPNGDKYGKTHNVEITLHIILF